MIKIIAIIVLTLIFFVSCDSPEADPPAKTKSVEDNYFIGRVTRPGRPEISFDMDYSMFFGDNNTYNHDIALASSVIAATYLRSAFFENLGLSDIVTLPIGLVDTDRAELLMGNRAVKYNDRTLTIVKVYVRDNNGSFEEMFSNLDIGADTAEYIALTSSAHSEWTNRYNFKGIDITANRAVPTIKEYVSSIESESPTVLWISGFGRGAAIANIIGTYFENDPDVIPFTYTFAAPNTTTSPEAQLYRTIFNIINTDDMTTLIPPAAWGFTRFGQDMAVSVAGHGQEAFKELTGIIYTYHTNSDIALNSLIGIAPTRESLYVINNNFFTVSEEFADLASAEVYKRRLESSLRPQLRDLAKFHVDETSDGGYRIILYQTPAFFVHALPETMTWSRDFSITLAEQFLWPRYFLITAYFESALGPPHQPITYYLIVRDFPEN